MNPGKKTPRMAADASKPLFNWLDRRASGVLLHPTCLPGDFGVGTFGSEARQFIDFLSEAGISHWQICPLGPTSYGDSPYQCPSAFAGNPYLIDPLILAAEGFIDEEKLGPLLFLPNKSVDFGGLY
jgi:4-alpha-glucanotransferase